MNKEHYEITVDANRKDFKFMSTGPNGEIIKIVQFRPWKYQGVIYHNLAFGDQCKTTGELDDLSKSNNNDREKVLTTVAATVLEFTKSFPNAMVYAEGSTASRTRLYQMSIAANLQDISKYLSIYGLSNGNWTVFEKNAAYDAFMVLRK